MKSAPNCSRSAINLLASLLGLYGEVESSVADGVLHTVISESRARVSAGGALNKNQRRKSGFRRSRLHQRGIDSLDLVEFAGRYQIDHQLIEFLSLIQVSFGFVVVAKIQAMGKVSRRYQDRSAGTFLYRFLNSLSPNQAFPERPLRDGHRYDLAIDVHNLHRTEGAVIQPVSFAPRIETQRLGGFDDA